MPDKNCRKTFLSLKKIDLVQLKNVASIIYLIPRVLYH